LLPDKEEPYPLDGWKKANLSLRAGVVRAAPLYLWYHVGKTASEMTPKDRQNIVTEIDINFGNDDPWYGFEKLQPPTTIGHNKVENVFVSVRRGLKCELPHGSVALPTNSNVQYHLELSLCTSREMEDTRSSK